MDCKVCGEAPEECELCGCCFDCCDCEEDELYDADELGLDPEEDDARNYRRG